MDDENFYIPEYSYFKTGLPLCDFAKIHKYKNLK